MFDIVSSIIIITLIIIIYKYFEQSTYDIIMVKTNVNNKSYLVRNLPDKQDAADLLGKISVKLEKLVNIINTEGYENIYNKYLNNDIENDARQDKNITSGGGNTTDKENADEEKNNILEQTKQKIKSKLRDDIERLVKNFNPDAFSETTPDAKYTSYSVNKGEKIVFCLRDKKEGEAIVKENIMTFVAIHELGHLMTKSIGHEPEFWNTFKLLLKIAIAHSIYKNIDFNSTPKEYCGVNITDTPLKLNTKSS